MNTKVYCIIVTYNAMKWVDRCLTSLRESNTPVHPIVVDNCSKDGTVAYIKENYSEVQLIVNTVNKGFGQANNQGIELAYSQSATHFFLLNQDAWVHSDSIQKMIEVQDKYNIAVVSPIHLNGSGCNYDFGFLTHAILAEEKSTYIRDLNFNELKDFYSVKSINAAAWMINRKTIEEIGGFDPLYFHYGEDTNYLQRLVYHKKMLAFVPQAYMHHDREFHGNQTAFKKHRFTRRLFDLHADINRSFYKLDKVWLQGNLYIIWKIVGEFLHLRINNGFSMIVDVIEYWLSINKVIVSREKNIKLAPNWLNIDNYE